MQGRATRMRTGGHNSRTVLASVIAGIFASTAAGVWYDPSDFSTMYQDSAGLTPVTAVEQPVGLMLDKSKGLARGSELAINGTFVDTTNWTLNATASITGGQLVVTSATSGGTQATNTGGHTVVGKFYLVTFDVVSLSAGSISVGTLVTPGAVRSAPGSYSQVLLAGGTDIVVVSRAAGTTCVVDNVSVKEILGSHILQATTTARPVLSARVNLLTRTEEITNAVWTKTAGGVGTAPVVTDNFGVAPDGTTTAARVQMAINGGTTTSDLSALTQSSTVVVGGVYCHGIWLKTNDGTTKVVQWRDDNALTYNTLVTVTPTWQFFRATGTAATTIANMKLWLRGAQGTADSADLLMWHPQTEQGSGVGRYQRVGIATDYNAVGFPLYLRFDGVDDIMSTPTVVPLGSISTFDTSCAFAREQNAAIAVLIEHGNGASAPDGSFAYFAPLTADTATNLFRLRGTVTIQNAVAQATNMAVVMSARSVINSGFVMRYNAGTVATNGTSQAGALTDQILYLGARASGTLPFKGRFYGLMIAGRRLSSGEMFNAERFLGQKSGVFV